MNIQVCSLHHALNTNPNPEQSWYNFFEPTFLKEAIMQAKIIIKRKFIKGKQREIIALLRELRSGALQQPGYISGETLTSSDDPQTLVVIGSWQDMESWINWRENDTRKTLERMLETYQETSSEYQELTLGTFIED
jgi:heme-degrading monooxygenase HmoA